MEYKFYDKNIVVGYIKELLHNFNLPVCEVYNSNYSTLYEGRVYIKNNDFCLCKNISNSLFLERKKPYVFNKRFINLTTNFNITSSEYDVKTHEYLGNYLRFIRNYYNIDLMPLYNCFSNRTLESIGIKHYKLKNGTLAINTNNYLYYLIPVKFNNDYTIAIDCPKQYRIFCAIYKNGIASQITKFKSYEELMGESLKNISGSSFYSPYIYSTKFNSAETLWAKENSLYMVLEVPLDIKSSVTILEGNYINTTSRIGCINSPKVVDVKQKSLYPSQLSLLSLNNEVSYPFADRLVEYLFKNPVVSNEKIEHNIERIQKLLNKNMYTNKGIIHDVWTDKIKENIYDFLLTRDAKTKDTFKIDNGFYEAPIQNKLLDNYKDILGYADRDVEDQLQNYGG